MDAQHAVEVLLFLLVLAAFVAPGYGWATWLHRARPLDGPGRVALGAAWSFAVFAAVGVPFLWFCGNSTAFRWLLYPVWAAFTAIAFVLYRKTPTATNANPEPARKPVNVSLSPWVYLGLAVWGIVGARAAFLWTDSPEDRATALAMAVAAAVLGAGLVWGARNTLLQLLATDSTDEEAPPRLWVGLAVAAVLMQAATVATVFRPDWDDCVYLAAVYDYQRVETFNMREPVRRHETRMVSVYRTMGLELWGAEVCNLTGANPQALFHTYLPPVFVLVVYAAYASLFARLIPRRWVPLAVLALSAYFVWGIGGPFSGANHFLIRVWQGKSLVAHWIVPLLAALLVGLARAADRVIGLSLLAVVVAGVAFSSSAVFLCGVLIIALTLALLPWATQRIHFTVMAAASVIPAAIVGLAILSDPPPVVTGSEGPTAVQAQSSEPGWQTWMAILTRDIAGDGCLDLLWLAFLPAMGLMTTDRKGAAFTAIYPVVLLATFLNPLFYKLVAANVTTQLAYYRLFWLLPIGPGLAMLLVLVARIVGRMTTKGQVQMPLAVMVAGALGMSLLPEKFVWDPENRVGVFMVPRVGSNVEKMPADLLEIARYLEADPNASTGAILCGEESTSFLTPWSDRFQYVVTRPLYDNFSFSIEEKDRPAQERCLLMLVAQHGPYAQLVRTSEVAAALKGKVPEQTILQIMQSDRVPQLKDLPAMLDRHNVRYVITPPMLWVNSDKPGGRDSLARYLTERAELLKTHGFRKVAGGEEYQLWVR